MEPMNFALSTTKKPAAPQKRGRPKKSSHQSAWKFPVEPRTIQVVKKPRTIVNHSYRDFTCIPPEFNNDLNKNNGETTSIKDMSFSQKLHEILSTKEYNGYITWMPHGRSFKVLIPNRIEDKVLPKYFGHSRYSSFLRALNNYGYKHLTKGTDRNCYYHECFLRGLPHLCKYMPKPKNARRLMPDVDNEPDFDKISAQYPVPVHNSEPTTSALSTMADVAASSPALVEEDQEMEDSKPAATEKPLSQEERPDYPAGVLKQPHLPKKSSGPLKKRHFKVEQHQKDDQEASAAALPTVKTTAASEIGLIAAGIAKTNINKPQSTLHHHRGHRHNDTFHNKRCMLQSISSIVYHKHRMFYYKKN